MQPIIDDTLIQEARRVATEILAPRAAEVDRARKFPTENFTALSDTRLMGMRVPKALGGGGASYSTYVRVMETLGAACASTGMCFLMHQAGVAILIGAPTTGRAPEFLEAVTRGRAIATQAFSEAGTGSHFYVPELQVRLDGDHVVLNGQKSWVTSGGHADLYVILTKASEGVEGLDMVVVERGAPGLSFSGEWEGMGLAGNNSVAMRFEDVRVPRGNIVGKEGDGAGLLFDWSAITFIIGQAALNVGIAQAALDAAIAHAKNRAHGPAGGTLGSHQAIRFYLAEMQIATESARRLVALAAADQDNQSEDRAKSMFASKVAACETSIQVTNQAMQVTGGRGYNRTMPIERLYRDARAGAIMGPTNELLKDFLGKTLLGMPLL